MSVFGGALGTLPGRNFLSTILSEQNRCRVMIRPRLRLYVCASTVAVSLGGAVLTQAAGPGEFISKLWKRDPAPKKEDAPSLNPFKFLRRESSDSTVRHVKVSDGGRSVISQRPELANDPFLIERLPQTNTPTEPGSKGVIVRPQPRQSLANTQQRDPGPTATERNSQEAASNVNRTRYTNSATAGVSNRAAEVAQQSLPEMNTVDASPTGNEQFVNGFDSEFQKLFKEVIEESRQSKVSAPTPRLPDEVVADFAPTSAAALPEVITSDADDLKKDLAEFAQERNRIGIDDQIRESRNQMESSVLARRANGDRRSQPSDAGRPVSQQDNTPQTSVSALAHSDSERTTTTTLPDSGAGFIPHTLPDRLPPQTVNQLVVPSSMVPERRMFTTSDGWMNRGELQRQAAAENAPPADLQPVVRVVPGHRGAGVVIETGQWSPIQPRVSSNVAPARSVPDTSQFRRLSFNGVDASTNDGAIQAIGNGSPNGDDLSTNSPHVGQYSGSSALIIPTMSDMTSTAPPALTTSTDSGEELAMIIPDSRTGQSLDAAELGAAFATAPAPPQSGESGFEWPDETEVAAEASSGGFAWGATVFFLAIAGGVIGLFFRRKAQDSAFGTTGTGTRSEIS